MIVFFIVVTLGLATGWYFHADMLSEDLEEARQECADLKEELERGLSRESFLRRQVAALSALARGCEEAMASMQKADQERKAIMRGAKPAPRTPESHVVDKATREAAIDRMNRPLGGAHD